jgi:hypothetical protein
VSWWMVREKITWKPIAGAVMAVAGVGILFLV